MTKKGKSNKDYLNNAVKSGIESIINEHPKFQNFQDYLVRHIDQNKIQEKYQELHQEASKNKMDEEQAKTYIFNKLSSYVASGAVLDEKGKQVILQNGLEEKTGFFNKIFRGKKSNGEKYLGNTMNAFNDLYELMKSGNYAEKMPELAESVSTLQDLNFLDPAVDVLKSYGLINDKRHKILKQNIYKRAEEETQKTTDAIERYLVPQKAAAIVVGFIGAILILFNIEITGAVIGGDSTITKGIVGIFMIFFALLLYLRPLKTSFKK